MASGRDFSIVEYFSGNEGSKCGYCKSTNGNYSHGMWAHKLMPQDYQDLIDRGWRRSGKYIYKPTMDVMCCPCYTIRCESFKFKPSKSQKKILKKFSKYLQSDVKPPENKFEIAPGLKQNPEVKTDHHPLLTEDKQTSTNLEKHDTTSVADTQTTSVADTQTTSVADTQTTSVAAKHNKKDPKPGFGPDPAKQLQKKAKVLRMEAKSRKRGTSAEEGLVSDVAKSVTHERNEAKTLESYLCESTESPKHNLQIKLIRTKPPNKQYMNSFRESYELFCKYQMTIHNDHVTDCTEDDFTRFLCDSPLQEAYTDGGPACGYGSFHQQYWLDDVLVAVGVLDILPNCISSVYLFYDPDYMFLNLGTYSSLREIEFTRKLQREAAGIQYYYMGFYIHSCQKMQYKGHISPSFLLCPESYSWQPIEQCRSKLDDSKYCRLDQTNSVNTDVDLDRVLVLHRGIRMPYYRYAIFGHDDKTVVQEYAKLVGTVCAQRMLLYRA